MARCIIVSHNKCAEIRLHPLTCTDGEVQVCRSVHCSRARGIVSGNKQQARDRNASKAVQCDVAVPERVRLYSRSPTGGVDRGRMGPWTVSRNPRARARPSRHTGTGDGYRYRNRSYAPARAREASGSRGGRGLAPIHAPHDGRQARRHAKVA